MELSDKIAAVSRMQKYINEHADKEITLDELGKSAGYSKYHAARIFKELTGKTPFEVIRAIRLTRAAEALRNTEAKVVDAYNPMLYGWKYAPELAPYFNFGAEAKTGARMARPAALL